MGFFSSILGTGAPEVPGLGPVGTEIQDIQLQQLRQAQQLGQQFLPQQLAQLGFAQDEQGAIRRLTPEEASAALSPEQQRAQANIAQLQERLRAGLAGELPVSPGLEADIEKQQNILQESIARRGQQRGTAEAQRQGQFQRASLIAREEGRRADISQTANILAQQRGLGENVLGQRLAQLQGIAQGGLPLIGAGATALQPSLQQQQLGFQANQLQQQAQQGLVQGIGQLAGTLGSAALTGGLSLPFSGGTSLATTPASAIGQSPGFKGLTFGGKAF